MRVLVIKTSSLGDIIHALPALSDAKRVYPEITFDWVVEKPFKEVPAWHPAVHRVIPVALRRWRKQLGAAFRNGEIRDFLKDLRQDKYDYIIDAQGLLKSVALTTLSRGGQRVGFSWHSARESLSSLFYQKKAVVPWEQHAVVRNRALFAQGLGYTTPVDDAEYGIKVSSLSNAPSQKPYIVFLHGTTWATKHWPESYWFELAKMVETEGFQIQLLWGNEEELARARRIAAVAPLSAVVVPNKLSLSEVAVILANARGIVSVDTGLGHLAAALNIPTVALYGPTNPKLSGLFSKRQVSLAADFPCAPCFGRECTYAGEKQIDPPCFTRLPPSKVWEHLAKQLQEV